MFIVEDVTNDGYRLLDDIVGHINGMLGEQLSRFLSPLAAFRDQFAVEQTSITVEEAKSDRVTVLLVSERVSLVLFDLVRQSKGTHIVPHLPLSDFFVLHSLAVSDFPLSRGEPSEYSS